MKKQTFILNDESKVNSYGFRILNAGINLDRFIPNPVMLDQHYNSTHAVVGKWNDTRIEGSQLLAESEFDGLDPDAKKLEGKVNRGYINSCSMGVTFNREFMVLAADGVLELTQCELYEVSIVAIPSNANSVRLFATTGELIPETELQLSLSLLANPETQNLKNVEKKENKMEKLILSALALTALGLSVSPEDAAALNASIEKLALQLNTAKADLATEKTAKEALQAKLQLQVDAQANALIETAVLEGKITADVKESFVQMAKNNYELTAKVIGAMAAKTTLAGKVINATATAGEVKDLEAFEKLPLAKQLAFKAENPEGYKALFA